MAIVTSANTLAYETNTNHPRDASFSCYLNGKEENCLLNLSESTVNPSPTITILQDPLYHTDLRGGKKPDGEICVFGAERYFNSKIDEEEKTRINEKVEMEHQNHHPKKEDRIVVHQMKPNMKPAAPSNCSERSWNSRSALLMGTLRDPSPSGQHKANGKSFLAALGCKCSCSDKNSVDIDETHKKNLESGDLHGRMTLKVPMEIKQDVDDLVQLKQNTFQELDNFTFPAISNSSVRKIPMEKQFGGEEQEMTRKSLEVFGSPVLDKEDIALNLEKRLNMLTWDANPRVEDIPAVPSTGDDSDSSSDLFEIKSLSSNTHPFLGRQGSDGMSVCMSPGTCYEPSEASIDWSVVTASAANFSVASDYDEHKSITSGKHQGAQVSATRNTSTSAKVQAGKEVPRRRPSILSGCRSYKAVNIVTEAHKMPQKKSDLRRPPRSDSITSMSRFQAEAKVTDFKSAQHAFSTRSVTQTHSVRTSSSLYMI